MDLPNHGHYPSGETDVSNFIFYLEWAEQSHKTPGPMEAMRFRGAPKCIIWKFLAADLSLGPVYIRKLDLSHMYMQWWVGMEDVLSVTFLISKKYGYTYPSPWDKLTVPPISAWPPKRWQTWPTSTWLNAQRPNNIPWKQHQRFWCLTKQ